METTFSIKRVILMIRRYIYENLYSEIMFWSIMTFIFTILDHRIFVLFVLFVSGFIYSNRLHKKLLRGQNGMQYMMLPATHLEKTIANFLLNTVYHFGMILLTYSIGNLLVTVVYHYILKLEVPVNWDLFVVTDTIYLNGLIQSAEHNVFFEIAGLYALTQSIITLGSLTFKNNIITKTSLTIIGIAITIAIFQLAIFKFVWDVKYLSNAIFPIIVMITDSTIPAIVDTAILFGSYLLFPFLWIISYFKLSEKQF